MGKSKFKVKGIPARQAGEESATENQLEYLRSLADFKESDLKSLGRNQAANLIERTKEERESFNAGKAKSRRAWRYGWIILLGMMIGVGFGIYQNSSFRPSVMFGGHQAANEPPKESRQETPPPPETATGQDHASSFPSETPPHGKAVSNSRALKSLADTPLPCSVLVTGPVSLLNAAGKEIPIPAGSIIKIVKRSDHGTLTMEIRGVLFVGNETRLAGKVELH